MPMVKHGVGCITAHGLRALSQIHGRMNKEMYIGILAEHLPNVVEGMPVPNRLVTFQHDNDPKNNARATREWLQSQRYHVMRWPAYSPDRIRSSTCERNLSEA